MKQILSRLFEGDILSKIEAQNILTEIAGGKYNNAHIAAFLTVFQMRSISAEELGGFRNALLELAVKADLSEFNTTDLCGTGGDGKNTFNISTLSSFIVAGAGQKVAKHGNYGVSSVSGSSNMLEHFGYKFTNDQDTLKRQIENAGICFLHAPLFHPAMKAVAPVRRELKLKTIFNLLGPVVNPSNPQNQLVGVYKPDILNLYAKLFSGLDKNYSIVHSTDGYDEISLTTNFILADKSGVRTITPDELNLPTYKQSDLHGGKDVPESGKIFLKILEGKGTQAQNDVVLANSAFALKTAQNLSFEDAFALAKESLISGKALKSFKTLMQN